MENNLNDVQSEHTPVPGKKITKIVGGAIAVVALIIIVILALHPDLLRRITGVTADSVTSTASTGNFNFIWGISGVGASNNNESDGVTVDNAGNVYVSGIFSETIDMGQGVLSLTSRGIGDIFVLKFDKTGKLLWHRQYGSTGNDNTFDVDIDPQGNLVLNGFFAGTVDFGGKVLTSQGGEDQFLMKMSPEGEVMWAKNFGGTSEDGGNEVTVDDNGNIFATAISVGTFTVGSFTLNNNGKRDSYMMKVSSFGEVLWVRGTSGGGNERLRAVSMDSAGNVFGGYEFSEELKVGTATYKGKGQLEGAIVKWDTNGNQLWSSYTGSTGKDNVRGVSPGPDGSFYVTGVYGADAQVLGVALSAANGDNDTYLAKFDKQNALEWMMTFEGAGGEGGGEIESDGAGNVAFSTDIMPNTTIRRDGAAILSLSPSSRHSFLIRISPEGTILSTNLPVFSDLSSAQTLGVSKDGKYVAQSIGFGGTLKYGNQTFTNVGKYKSFVIAFFSSEGVSAYVPNQVPTNDVQNTPADNVKADTSARKQKILDRLKESRAQ